MNRLLIALAAGAACLMAQTGEPINVPFSDASRPRFVKINSIQGRITVHSYPGKEVIVDFDGERKEEPPRSGMRRLNMPGSLTIEEENNVVNIRTSPGRRANLNIQVPVQTALTIRSVNDCNIDVKGYEGDIDANCTNGSVNLENISGSVLAHSLNGRVKVIMDKLAGKPMALSTLNGDVDLTLPASAKADVKLKSSNGDIYTDFDVTIGPLAGSTIERSREGGKYRVQIDRGVQGRINGGGPLISLTTLNGRIYLRKK